MIIDMTFSKIIPQTILTPDLLNSKRINNFLVECAEIENSIKYHWRFA